MHRLMTHVNDVWTGGTRFFADVRLWCALKCEFSTEAYQSRNQFVSCQPEMERISETLWFCAVEWDDRQSGDKESSTVSQTLFLLSCKHHCIGLVCLWSLLDAAKCFGCPHQPSSGGAFVNSKSERERGLPLQTAV